MSAIGSALGAGGGVMAPNLGQGGCQAVEDAVVLAHATPGVDPTPALAVYSAEGCRAPPTSCAVHDGSPA